MEITYKLVTRVTQYFSFPNKHEKWGHLGFLERGGGNLGKGGGYGPPYQLWCHKQQWYVCFLRYEVQQTKFLSFWVIFCPFTPLTTQKIKIKKKWKKHMEIPLFYTSLHKIMIICYTDPEIWCVADLIVIFHFGLFFAHLPLTLKISKKWKKYLEISFYTSVPIIMILCHTVLEILCMM